MSVLYLIFFKKALKDAGRNDLAEKVIWHQASKLDRTPGWDITSYKPDTGEVIAAGLALRKSANFKLPAPNTYGCGHYETSSVLTF